MPCASECSKFPRLRRILCVRWQTPQMPNQSPWRQEVPRTSSPAHPVVGPCNPNPCSGDCVALMGAAHCTSETLDYQPGPDSDPCDPNPCNPETPTCIDRGSTRSLSGRFIVDNYECRPLPAISGPGAAEGLDPDPAMPNQSPWRQEVPRTSLPADPILGVCNPNPCSGERPTCVPMFNTHVCTSETLDYDPNAQRDSRIRPNKGGPCWPNPCSGEAPTCIERGSTRNPSGFTVDNYECRPLPAISEGH